MYGRSFMKRRKKREGRGEEGRGEGGRKKAEKHKPILSVFYSYMESVGKCTEIIWKDVLLAENCGYW